MPTTFDVLYLGNVPLIDTVEGNAISENAASLVNETFGTIADPLYGNVRSFSPGSTGFAGGTPDAYDSNNLFNSDTFRIDGGPDRFFTANVVYETTITYTDGTTAQITAVVFQDTSGDLFLAPEPAANTDQAALEAKAIRSLTFDAITTNNSNMSANRDFADFVGPDGTVSGTAGDDVIGDGYIDAQGDEVDGADGDDDIIDAGAGNDTVNAGAGDDIIMGGAGSDQIFGGAGDDAMDGGADSDELYGGGGDDRFVFDDIDNTSYFVPDGVNLTGGGAPVQINQTTSGNQSPPKLLTLEDGRTLYIWTNNATADGPTDVQFQGRIMNADGTPSTNQFSLDSLPAVDGVGVFDWDNMDIALLPNGNVVIGWVRATDEPGDDEPLFAIIEPTATGVNIVQGATEVQSTDTTLYESPPKITVLDNGNILFTWANDATANESATMQLQGRIFDPDTQSFTGGDFNIGTRAVSGSDAYDVDNMNVMQLAGGNIVVSYVQSSIYPTSASPIFTILDENGATIASDQAVQETDTGGPFESAAKIIALEDGNWMGVWLNDGQSDNTATMTLEGRVFDANGNPVTGDFNITTTAVDGNNGFDIENFSVEQMPDGKIVVGFVENSATSGDGSSLPRFSIIDASDSSAPTVTQDIPITAAPSNPFGGPPLIEALGDTGYFVAVYGNGDAQNGGTYGINYRIFDAETGNPLTGEIAVVNGVSNQSVSGSNLFDWGSIDVEYNETNGSFTIGWVSINDGSGTGVASSGPIFVSTLDPVLGPDTPEIVVGGETDETFGDVIDLNALTEDLTLVYSGDEAGSVTENATGESILFSEIERLELGSGDDTVDATATTGGVNVDAGEGDDTLTGGSGDDTLLGGDGDDIVFGGDGDDTLTGGDGEDTFGLADGSGTDTITDFDMTDNGGQTTDRFDVSNLTNAGGDPVRVWDVTVGDTNGDETGDAILYFPNGESVILQGVTFQQVDEAVELISMGIPCFGRGTPILTPKGWKPVERLSAGDLVTTYSGRHVPVIWTGKRGISRGDLAKDEGLLPVRIAKGALGNRSDLLLSPQHAVLMQSTKEGPVLVRAKHLAKYGSGAFRVARGKRKVDYFHVLLPKHDVMIADGALMESMYPGHMALSGLYPKAKLEICAAILKNSPARLEPVIHLDQIDEIYGPTAYRIMSGGEVEFAFDMNELTPFGAAQQTAKPTKRQVAAE